MQRLLGGRTQPCLQRLRHEEGHGNAGFMQGTGGLTEGCAGPSLPDTQRALPTTIDRGQVSGARRSSVLPGPAANQPPPRQRRSSSPALLPPRSRHHGVRYASIRSTVKPQSTLRPKPRRPLRSNVNHSSTGSAVRRPSPTGLVGCGGPGRSGVHCPPAALFWCPPAVMGAERARPCCAGSGVRCTRCSADTPYLFKRT